MKWVYIRERMNHKRQQSRTNPIINKSLLYTLFAPLTPADHSGQNRTRVLFHPLELSADQSRNG